MRGQTLIPAVCACRLIRGRIVSQIAFEQVLHLSMWYGRSVHPFAFGHHAPRLEIDLLRQLPVRRIGRSANLSSPIIKLHPPDCPRLYRAMGVPLSCGPVLVWFPVARGIDRALGLGNEGVYVVSAVSVP